MVPAYYQPGGVYDGDVTYLAEWLAVESKQHGSDITLYRVASPTRLRKQLAHGSSGVRHLVGRAEASARPEPTQRGAAIGARQRVHV